MQKTISDNACICNRLFTMLRASVALQDEIISCLSRLTVLQVPLLLVDNANLVDRLHELFNSYSQLTRCNGWHDEEYDEGQIEEQRHSRRGRTLKASR